MERTLYSLAVKSPRKLIARGCRNECEVTVGAASPGIQQSRFGIVSGKPCYRQVLLWRKVFGYGTE